MTFTKDIKFKKLTYFTGRNGFCNMSGVRVTRFDGGNLLLEPFTSRNKIGRCELVIDKDSVDDLIAALNQLKNYF